MKTLSVAETRDNSTVKLSEQHLLHIPSRKQSQNRNKGGSYVYVLLAEVLWIFVHHVGQMSPPQAELLPLLLDQLRPELRSSGRRHLLPMGGGAQTHPPVGNLGGRWRF